MSFSLKLFSKMQKYFFVLIVLLFISAISVAFSKVDQDGFNSARREVLLRRIGHELLLQSGDSTSRVLPVKKIAEDKYQIRFENEFTFQPDSLVNTTKRLLAKDAFANDYVVKVLNCDDSSVVYGFAISKNIKDDIVACLGRKQPIACYIIDITFKSNAIITARNGYFLGGLTLLAFVGFVFLKSVKSKNDLPRDLNDTIFTIGTALFDVQKKQLLIDKKTIDLTKTETRLLFIFASSLNQTIERSRLQKEIWEDDGVILGRSLDMFISKLRKKLETEPNINIVAVRNKGYKLEVKS